MLNYRKTLGISGLMAGCFIFGLWCGGVFRGHLTQVPLQQRRQPAALYEKRFASRDKGAYCPNPAAPVCCFFHMNPAGDALEAHGHLSATGGAFLAPEGLNRDRVGSLKRVGLRPIASPELFIEGQAAKSGGSRVGNPASGAIFEAIRQVESGGDDSAVGDGGLSRGPYQIGMAYWTDAIEFGGVQWDYLSLVRSRPHCEQVMTWYWRRYGAKTDEDRIRLHNGGPGRRGTDEYFTKVMRAMR